MNEPTTKRLKYAVSLRNSKIAYSDCDRSYIGLEDIESWTGRLIEGADKKSDGTVSLYEPNDVLFGKLRPYLAKVHMAEKAGACSTEALVLRSRNNCLPSFLKYVLLDPRRVDEINSSTFGAQMPRASWDFIGNCRVLWPDLPTQQSIADFLDRETARIDQLIEKKQSQVDLLLMKEHAALTHAFNSLEAVTWRVRHLGKIQNGAGFPVELQGDPTQEFPFYKVKHLKNYGLDAAISGDEDTVSEGTARSLRATIFPARTIVFAKIGAALLLGRFSMLGRAACIDNNMAAFVANEHLIDPDYALLALSQIDMTTLVQPGTVPSLSTEAFYSYGVRLPAKNSQSAFVDTFRTRRDPIRRVVAVTKKSTERLREFRSALITAAVTGQIDVATWGKQGHTDRRLDKIEQELHA